jgi:hypothetical protein
MMVLLLVLLLTLPLSACGAAPRADSPEGAAPGARDNGPPPAWIETKAGTLWLGFSSSCWSYPLGNARAHTCADFIAPECGHKGVPDVRVNRGDTVRAHLGFTPTEASVGSAEEKLEGRVLEWPIERAGVFSLFAKKNGDDASYVGCAVLG